MDARSLLALANLNKHDRYQADRAKLQTAKKEDWRWVGYDSTIGMGIVQSGNITRMGKVITNGYLVEGQPVEFNQDGQFGTIEGMPYVRPKPQGKKTYVPKDDIGGKIALLYISGDRFSPSAQLLVGAVGASPIALSQKPQNSKISKTADGWIASTIVAPIVSSLGTNFANSSSTVSIGDAESATLIWAEAPLSPYVTPFYQATGINENLGYGYVSPPEHISNTTHGAGYWITPFVSSFEDSNPSPGTRNATWSEGFIASGVPTFTVGTSSMTNTSDPSLGSANRYTMTGSGSGMTPLPDGALMPWTYSYYDSQINVTDISHSYTRLFAASEDPNNYITISFYSRITRSGGVQPTGSSEQQIVLRWRRNGVESEIASQTRPAGSGLTVDSEHWLTVRTNRENATLVGGVLYIVSVLASSPETGKYSVDAYQLPSMTKTTEIITANPVAEYAANNGFWVSASYHP